MEARLVITTKDGDVREIKMDLPATLGRSRQAKVSLVHTQISRVHCELFEKDGALYVRDLDSTNGTYVNDKRVEGEVKIPTGSFLKLGDIAAKVLYGNQPDVMLAEETLSNDTIQSGSAEDTFADFELAPLEEPDFGLSDTADHDLVEGETVEQGKATKAKNEPATADSGAKKQEDDDLDDFFNSLM